MTDVWPPAPPFKKKSDLYQWDLVRSDSGRSDWTVCFGVDETMAPAAWTAPRHSAPPSLFGMSHCLCEIMKSCDEADREGYSLAATHTCSRIQSTSSSFWIMASTFPAPSICLLSLIDSLPTCVCVCTCVCISARVLKHHEGIGPLPPPHTHPPFSPMWRDSKYHCSRWDRRSLFASPTVHREGRANGSPSTAAGVAPGQDPSRGHRLDRCSGRQFYRQIPPDDIMNKHI